uniref:Uncharacterized protein n=1 Tax=Avena sativa TaxID=4498 RepID=A0ACD5TVW4_AVESA
MPRSAQPSPPLLPASTIFTLPVPIHPRLQQPSRPSIERHGRSEASAAVLDAGHATATQASATACKRSRSSMASTDDYDDVACLGKGAFGFVIKSRHRATGKIVAVKRRHEPPLPESKVRAFMWKLLTGAKMMHDRHVVHRDIKPANILVGQDGELVKICDLGLAITMSDSPPYSQAGTLPYLAPEMLLHKPNYDALVDTWSLGCVMAEMITGKALFYDAEDGRGHEFNDTSHIVQLRSIFRVLGMPDDQTWPEFMTLPLTTEALQLLPAGHKHNRLRDIFPEEKLSKEGFEVLQGLLTCNPDKRLTAAKALKHPWFAAPRPSSAAAAAKVDVLPVLRKKMPRFMVALEVVKAQRV